MFVKIVKFLTVCLLITATMRLKVSVAGIPKCNSEHCPFDDLSEEEIKDVVSIIQTSGYFRTKIAFPIIRMQEPRKSDWFSGRSQHQRFAYTAVFEFSTNIITEVLIDLRLGVIIKLTALEDGIAPPMLEVEDNEVIKIVKNDIRWQEAVKKRGILLDEAVIHCWLPGSLLDSENGPGKRLIRTMTYYTMQGDRYHHWAVLEGIIATVDLVKGSVIDLWDDELLNLTSPLQELPNFESKPQIKPLEIIQSQGSSIIVNGQEISWYKWRMRYSVDPIFGLQLYHVTYQGDCVERSILYKISLGEMFIPYGMKGRTWRWRNAFDAGEYGIGKNANSLKIGLDIPENAILFNCTIASDTGEKSIKINGCVGAFERDTGVIFKHQGWGEASGRRGRELVITLMTTIGNYDYSYDYIFHMSGVIEVKSKLTGIILPKGSNKHTNEPQEGEQPCLTDCLTLLNDYIVGPSHQHFYNYRIDLDVDGSKNYVTEVNVTPDPVGSNPNDWDYGMFSPKSTILTNEIYRDHDFQSHRTWHVINAHSRNDYGSPRGYVLKPGDALAYSYLTEPNPIFGRSKFIQHPFWATLYKDNEQTPSDRFPRTGRDDEGLPKYISNSESLEDTDTVLWYTFGVMHNVKPEDFPIMNVNLASGFSLLPFNFMSQNSEMALKDRCP